MARVISFKIPLSLDGQIEHLKKSKNLCFINTDEANAKEFLYIYNYINVISPFKYIFCKKDKNDVPIKYNNSHIYENQIDFSQYQNYYNNERKKYPKIYENILKIETTFNAILSYETLNKFKLHSESDFDCFIEYLKRNLLILVNKSYVNTFRYNSMLSGIHSLKEYLKKYSNVYVFFDRLSASELLVVFMCLDNDLKKLIFNELQKRNLTLNIPDIETFEKSFFKIVSIRNCVCHGNSLEILVRFANIKSNRLRPSSEIKAYNKLIKKLSL